MKSQSDNAAVIATLAFAFCLCGSLIGCGDSSSGIPYSQLPVPQTAAFAEWSPLPAIEPKDSAVEASSAASETSDTVDSGKDGVDQADQIQQIAANASPNDASEITQAVATDDPSTKEISATEPALLPPDMTEQERMNMLMNNPDLEETTEVLEVKLLIPDKRFRKEDGGKVVRVSYDDIDLLKVLNMQPVPEDAVSHFPDWLSGLAGQRIRIRGFMIPPYQSEGLKRFALARDNGICCFVRTPKIYDVINVRMAKNQTTDYIANKPFDVQGTFRIEPYYEDGEWYSLYEIEDATVTE